MDKRDVILPDASHVNGTSEGGTTESVGVTAAEPTVSQAPEGVAAGLRPGFLAELAVAMRATAEKERERIAGKVADDAAAHIDKVRARAAIETDELKRLAEEDVHHIESWSAAEMERIRGEADRKIEDRRASLEEYLKQHDTIIDTEIDGVNAAVQDYNGTLDRYFEDLAGSSDPAAIVARAEALPAPPDLDAIRAQARARAVSQFAEREDERPAAEAAPAAEAPIEPAAATAPLVAGASMAEIGAVAEESKPIADTTSQVETVERAEPVMAEPIEPPVRAETVLIGDTPPQEMPRATSETPASEPEPAPVMDPAATANSAWPTPVQQPPSASEPQPEPVPVMDPAATANTAWPTPVQGPVSASESEPEPVAASVDHTSAAVRLLRSVAPWTAPTHAGSNDRSETE